MRKLPLACLFIALLTVLLPGCDVITGEIISEPAEGEIPVSTEFGRMLGYVPYSLIEEHDIWFGNPGKTREMYGLEDAVSYEKIKEVIKQIPEEREKQFISDLNAALIALPTWSNRPEITHLTGLDIMAATRLLCGDVVPPHGYFILEGVLDEELIGRKLTEQGYTKTDYGQYSYYGIRGDFDINIRSPLGTLVLANMNRVAVLDNTIITSPVTTDITGFFDVIDGDMPSAIDNTACRALADSLGDVLGATLTTPERIIFSDLAAEEEKPVMFDFTVPADWGTLQGYEMAGLGYCADGESRVLDIALYYEDKVTATADGQEIVKRILSYEVGTTMGGMKKPDEALIFTDWWQPGEPVVMEYDEGVVLKISCHQVTETPRWVSTFLGSNGVPFRDLLFLAPDPSPYIGENESKVIIRQSNP